MESPTAGTKFDDDDVVGMFALGIIALGSGNERLVKEAIVDHVVTEMVVGGDGQRLDTGVDQDLSEDRLEIAASDEAMFALCKLDDTRNKRVLGTTADEGLALEDSSDGEES